MSNIPTVSGKKLLAILRKHGFVAIRQHGSHVRVTSMDGKCKTVVPIHANRDLPKGTLKNILNDLNISTDDFLTWR